MGELGKFGPSLAVIRVWMGVLRKWRRAAHRFLDDPTKIAANPPTHWLGTFSILIAANDNSFLTPYTHAPERVEIGKIRPILSRD